MFGAVLKATNSSFQKGMTFCRSVYVKKVMKLLAFIFEQPSYSEQIYCENISKFYFYKWFKNKIKKIRKMFIVADLVSLMRQLQQKSSAFFVCWNNKKGLYGKRCWPRSDCSHRSSLFWVQAVCFYTSFVSNVRQLFAADDIFRCIFSWLFNG